MAGDIIINLPLYIRSGRKSRFSLNLNVYRNAHFHTLANAKEGFEAIVAKRIGHLPVMTKAELTYTLFFGSKRHIDISNICCIVDKFFCDTLVNQGKLIDDNMDAISRVTYQWGEVDAHDPRIEVTLTNIETAKDMQPMQIILTQQEVEEAIRESVLQQIAIREDQGISITFTGIKEGSFAVNVLIQKLDESSPKKIRTRRTVQPGPDSVPTDETPQEEPAKAHISVEEVATTPAPIFPQVGEPTVQAMPAVAKIFPDVHSSAPVIQETPAPAAKSLFANLTKPVHDAHPHKD